MRILFLTGHLRIGGIPVYTVTLARALARRGHQPIVASSGGALVEALAAAGVPHVRMPIDVHSPLHPSALRSLVQLRSLIHRYHPDVMHAQTRVAHVLAGVAGRLAGVPVVTTAHGFYQRRWWRRTLPFWGRRVIAVSPSVKAFMCKAYDVPADKIAVVLNGIEWTPPAPAVLDAAVERFRRAWGLSAEGGPILGMVARLSVVKGAGVLLEAFHRLRRTVPAARLLIVGDGPSRADLIKQAYALGEQGRVVLAGTVDGTAVPLHVMDLFVLPSMNEAFGLAIVEAMAMGRPVVASRVGGIPDLVEDGRTGLLVPPGDAEALARALERLIADPAAARAMGQAGRARYEQRFTMDRVARDTERVYDEARRG